jgi:hypothetical protein
MKRKTGKEDDQEEKVREEEKVGKDKIEGIEENGKRRR